MKIFNKMKIRLFLLMLVSLPLYLNCSEFSAPEEGLDFSSLGNNSKFQCEPTSLPTVSNTRRLTKNEYLNTLKDLTRGFSQNDQEALWNYIKSYTVQIPDDTNIDNRFSENSNFVSQQLIDAFIDVGIGIADFIAASEIRLTQFIGSCAAGGEVDQACITRFSIGMGKKIFRRPLSPTEIQDLGQNLSMYSDSTAKWLLARMFSSPHFFMHIEDSKKDLGGGLHEITDYALANRISYFLFDTMPDDELFSAAENGSLATASGIESQIMRMSTGKNQDRLSSLMSSFFNQWLKIDEMVLPDPQANPLMQNYANGDQLTKASIKNEIHEMINYFTFENPGRFTDLFTTEISFAVDDNLARIYGVPKWDGNPRQLVRFPSGQRSGLLTRAAFLANQGSLAKPIQRGIHIRHDLLCDALPPPPPEIFEMREIPFDPDTTTRERITRKTSDKSCMGCHSKINDTGFALGNYDSFGRFVFKEKIFDPQTGALLQEHPVDTHVQPNITPETSNQIFNSAIDFSRAIAESGAAERCFVTTFYEFVFRKSPDIEADGCQLEQMRANVNDAEGSLSKLLFSIPTSRQFRLKRVDQ